MVRWFVGFILVGLMGLGQALAQTQVRGSFTDQDLQQLLSESERKQSAGIIWVWSPRMVLSYAGFNELKPISLLLNLESTLLVDPFVRETEIAATAFTPELQASRLMRSHVLNNAGALLHFPVLFIYKNGKILLPGRPGYDEPWRLYDYLVRRLQ